MQLLVVWAAVIGFYPVIQAEQIRISTRTHNGSDHQPPEDPHQYDCHDQIHPQWHRKLGNFYIIFFDQPCRFPEGEETCQQNNATIAYPEDREEQELLQELSNPLTGDTWIGYHLPLEIPTGNRDNLHQRNMRRNVENCK